jgi:type III pantothenate kinase
MVILKTSKALTSKPDTILMERTLCLDFGNTRLKCAIFNKDLEDVLVLEAGSENVIADLLQKYQPAKTILSSVINHDPAIEPLLASRTKFHKLGAESKLPLSIPVGKPETVGADRLALSVAAVHLYPKQHNLVIGLGSCITYNFVNKFSQFLGGTRWKHLSWHGNAF